MPSNPDVSCSEELQSFFRNQAIRVEGRIEHQIKSTSYRRYKKEKELCCTTLSVVMQIPFLYIVVIVLDLLVLAYQTSRTSLITKLDSERLLARHNGGPQDRSFDIAGLCKSIFGLPQQTEMLSSIGKEQCCVSLVSPSVDVGRKVPETIFQTRELYSTVELEQQ